MLHKRKGKDKDLEQRIMKKLVASIVSGNPYARVYRSLRDRILSKGSPETLQIRIHDVRGNQLRTFNRPSVNQVTGIFIDRDEESENRREILVQGNRGGISQIRDTHPGSKLNVYSISYPTGLVGWAPGHRLLTLEEISQREKALAEGRAWKPDHRISGVGLANNEPDDKEPPEVDPEQPELTFPRGRTGTKLQPDPSRQAVSSSNTSWMREVESQTVSKFREDAAADSVGQPVILPSSFEGGPRNKERSTGLHPNTKLDEDWDADRVSAGIDLSFG
ncbi:hypothetical protein BDK51DRAFT_41757 [Blyttiomyces helicus]|uniref:Uncharacterized protein n=1 Tax=Blyttiomyces helicus TaxID=388810 RepID=A0A4P9WJ52_9FUNG|nr:hypothetical protein BDK51DRAFT_41757 [Blyttiomyces helicus]|eukprot:RKO92939.1 hypothetical protein BDK51DRAFT_41757 [Blyttiomyces helicus]